MNERLKTIRNYYNLNVRDFGERIGVSGSAISLLETGKRNFSAQVIKSICREYEINETWFTTGNGDMLSVADREYEVAQLANMLIREDDDSFRYKLIKLVSQMSEEQIQMCKEFIEKLNN